MSDTTRGAGITLGRIDAICPMMCYFCGSEATNRREMVAAHCMILQFKQ